MPYNPFPKPIGDRLSIDDLQALVTDGVTEGYWVEFKQQFPAPEKIARSLASLANSYGGWYIVGVAASKHAVAQEICGFELSRSPDPLALVQESAKAYLDPVPVFHPQLIETGENRAVVVIFVPDGQDSPIITKDGRLYRRTNESSDPIPEGSRYVLDQLYERGKESKRRFERFAIDHRIIDKQEANGWLKIYISPYPLGLVYRPELLSITGADELLSAIRKPIPIRVLDSTPTITSSIPISTIQMEPSSIVLRQAIPFKEGQNSLSLELDIHGRAKIYVPVSEMNEGDLDVFKGWSQHARMIALQRAFAPCDAEPSNVRLFDLGRAWIAVAILVSFYEHWLGDVPTHLEAECAVEVDGVLRYAPFCDSKPWATFVETYGLPVLLSASRKVPNSGPIRHEVAVLWAKVCSHVGSAFGLPSELSIQILINIILSEGGLPFDMELEKDDRFGM